MIELFCSFFSSNHSSSEMIFPPASIKKGNPNRNPLKGLEPVMKSESETNFEVQNSFPTATTAFPAPGSRNPSPAIAFHRVLSPRSRAPRREYNINANTVTDLAAGRRPAYKLNGKGISPGTRTGRLLSPCEYQFAIRHRLRDRYRGRSLLTKVRSPQKYQRPGSWIWPAGFKSWRL